MDKPQRPGFFRTDHVLLREILTLLFLSRTGIPVIEGCVKFPFERTQVTSVTSGGIYPLRAEAINISVLLVCIQYVPV